MCADDSTSVLWKSANPQKPSVPTHNQSCTCSECYKMHLRLLISFSSCLDTVQFIHDVRTSQHLCSNPSLLYSQCLYQGTNPRDTKNQPLFVQSKTYQGGGLLSPNYYGYDDDAATDVPPWKGRSDKVFWRGSTTGCWHSKSSWRESHRVRLHFLVNDPPEVGLDDTLPLLIEEQGGALKMKTLSRSEFNAAFVDVGLVGPPIICGKEDGACDAMRVGIDFLPRVSASARKEVNKYMIDVGENLESQL